MRLACALMAATGAAALGTPAAAADYVVIRHEVEVQRPAEQVWARIGGYCAIAEWMKISCDYASGTGDVGTVRRLGGAATVEVMVARTAHSYTYLQTVGKMAPAGYHGTLAAEPDGPGKSRLFYTLFYDQSAMPSDAVRQSEHDRLDHRFADLLGVMKTLAEGR